VTHSSIRSQLDICIRCSAGQFLFMGGCYDTHAAPGSGVCREARGGACVMHKEEDKTDKTSTGVIRAGTGDTCIQGTTSGTPESTKCKTDKCDVTIGGSQYCSQCSVTTEFPINGVCTTDKGPNTNQCAAGKCTSCGDGYFLHKGGCYKKGQDPGQAICKDTADTTAGVCDECQAGFFKNPANLATSDSCIACGDATGVTVGSATYKGVLNCATCTAPAKAENGNQIATCTACVDGKYGADCANSCDESCKTCTGAGTAACTSCKDPSPYFKKGTGETGECVAKDACTSTHFPTTDATQKKVCTLCNDAANGGIADCQTCLRTGGTFKCSACNNDKKPNTAGTACVACTIADCASCDKENVCAACTDKKLSPLKDACLDSCPAGTYDSSNVCTPCHTSCAECNNNANQDSCTACYPGRVLSKGETGNTGTCIPECTGRYAENCEANQCTAVLGGSKYCSKCKSGYVPVDGLCVSSGTTRAPPAGCTPGDGVCSSCTGTYFLESGGCYQSTAYPGNTLCSSAATGKCTKCANGQTADTSTGVCPACLAGCSKCSGSGDPKTCSECLAGYYKSGTSCVKCDKDDSNIKGVPNCVSCAPPTGNSGPVTCYVTQEPSVNPTDPSVNKSSLSTGAIAGISVAAVVVVGGLVGFLCWWFLCRGKA
ncbi:Variant-specific surface protein, partial [Giardia duodenalis]